jgi:hypothetical protein
MASTTVENARKHIGAGIDLVAQTVTYTYHNGATGSYNTYDLDGLSSNEMANLAKLALVLKDLPEEGALDLDYDALYDLIKEWASETAESAEVPFTFEDRDGFVNTYTPASLWESSGGCEWETSAQEGYDYGWNV